MGKQDQTIVLKGVPGSKKTEKFRDLSAAVEKLFDDHRIDYHEPFDLRRVSNSERSAILLTFKSPYQAKMALDAFSRVRLRNGISVEPAMERSERVKRAEENFEKSLQQKESVENTKEKKMPDAAMIPPGFAHYPAPPPPPPPPPPHRYPGYFGGPGPYGYGGYGGFGGYN